MRETLKRAACAVLLAAPIALASAPAALAATPTATTGGSTVNSSSSATVNGTVNPQGLPTGYTFQYGTTTGYGSESPVPFGAVAPGTTDQAESATLTGLLGGTTYHYRIVALYPGGETFGNDNTFTTSAGGTSLSGTPPTATSAAATAVHNTDATLNGSVNPGGQATSYYFEYGHTNNYGFQTASTSAGSGSSAVNESTVINGLTAGTTYHFRLVAVNAGGTSFGADQQLTTTQPPAAVTGGASAIGPSTATINGTVNPNGQATTDYFQFGTSTAYGLQTTPITAGSGTTPVTATASLSALQSGTTYHFRVVAVSATGTTYGTDNTFTTTSYAPTNSVLNAFGFTGFVDPHGVGGVFVGCIGQTPCTGSMSLSRSHVTLATRSSFTVGANDGGIVHFQLSALGRTLLHRRHQLTVQLTVAENGGNKITKRFTLVQFSV